MLKNSIFQANMEKFVINGGKKLNGVIEVKGAKNAALKAFGAALLTTQPVVIKNVPEVEDVKRMAEILQDLGVNVKHSKNGEYKITAEKITSHLIKIGQSEISSSGRMRDRRKADRSFYRWI